MRSLNNGETTPRTFRVPDALWTRLTQWAQRSGLGDSEALRELLALGLKNDPGVVLRPAQAWMLRSGLHPEEWLLAQVPPGSDAWDLDDILGQVPGARRYDRRNRNASQVWWQVPRREENTLRELFAGRPDRLRLHEIR